MKNYNYVISEKIEGFNREDWNELIRNGKGTVFHSFEWLKSFELSGPANYTPFYIGIFSDEKLIGAAPFFETKFCPKLEIYKKTLSNDKTGYLDKTLLLGHSLYGQYSQIISMGDRRAVVAYILDVVHEISTQRGIPIFGMPLIHESDYILLEETSHREYITGYFNSVCRLYIRWQNFEEYLYSFKNSKRRKIRKLIRECEEKGLACVEEITLKEIVKLASTTCTHHKVPTLFPIDFVKTIMSEMELSIRIFAAKVRNRPIGVMVCFIFENVLTPWLVGLDYDSSKEYNQYNYLYCKIIEYAIKNEIDLIEFGRGTFYIKTKYGCSLEKLYVSLKGRTNREKGLAKKWCEGIERGSIDYLNSFCMKYGRNKIVRVK